MSHSLLLEEVFESVGVESRYPMIAVDDALDLVLQHTPKYVDVVRVKVVEAINFVSAADVICSKCLPSQDVSIVDGFAVNDSHNGFDKDTQFRVVNAIAAGAFETNSLALRSIDSGEAVYVTTGAPIPPTANRVVPIEHCQTGKIDGTVCVACLDEEGGNTWIRSAGSDVPANQVNMHSVQLCLKYDIQFL